MKFHHLIPIAAFFCLNSLFAQKMDGEVKPKIVTAKPAATDYFFSNKITKPHKIDRELPVVLTQFNVTIPQDQEFYARTGSGKVDMNDAQLLLKFHISNLDKAKFQKATDELADYLKERLQAQGFKMGTYADFSSGKKYESMDKNPAPKGEIPQLFGPAFTIPGEFKLANKAIMFSAYEQPLYAAQSMKVGYIMIEKKINLLSFGWVLNFIELETKSKITNTSNSINMSFNGQLYGNPSLGLLSPNITSISIQPNLTDRAKDAIYGYSFGREFTKNINKENGDVEVDNDKFIAAYLELGKSYIDNMTELMAPSK